MEKNNILATEKISVLLRKFATPSIIAMLVGALYNIIDQIFIGNAVGMYGNAATNVALPFLTICLSWALMSGVGGASGFNLNLGAGNKKLAAQYLTASLTMMAAGGTLIAVIGSIFLEPLLIFCGSTAEVLPYAVTFTGISCLGLPFLVFATGASHLIRADGSPKYAMALLIAGAVINCVLNPLFIFVFKWGIAGSAWATVIGQFVSSAMALYYLCCHYQSVKITRDSFNISAGRVLHVMVLGSSNCINQLSMMIVQITLNNTLNYYGSQSAYGSDIPLAVVGIITKVSMLFFSVIIGISQGMQPIVSYNYGAENYRRVADALKLGLKLAFGISLMAFFMFQIFPREIISVFGKGSEMYFQFAEEYFHIFLFGTFYNFIQPMVSNFFAAIGKGPVGAVLALSRQIIFLLPLIVILPYFLGIDGVMYAGVVADTMSAVLALLLCRKELLDLFSRD